MSDLDAALVVAVPIAVGGSASYLIAELAQLVLDWLLRHRIARRERRVLASFGLHDPADVTAEITSWPGADALVTSLERPHDDHSR